MKTSMNYQPNGQTAAARFSQIPRPGANLQYPDHRLTIQRPFGLLTEAAASAIVQGDIPDFSQVSADLYTALADAGTAASAIGFISILKALESPSSAAFKRFINGQQQSYVLVQNELIKVILIRWKPGEYSKVHGHPNGGGVFKVLHGRIEEKRYAPGTTTRPLATSRFKKGSMAYIDDDMAYHAVGNPFDTTAISFHAYTAGGHATGD